MEAGNDVYYKGEKKTIIKLNSFDIRGVSYSECVCDTGRIGSYPTNKLEIIEDKPTNYTREEVLNAMERAVDNYKVIATEYPDGSVAEVEVDLLQKLLDNPKLRYL